MYPLSLGILFRRFVGGKNFMPWFQRRRAATDTEQQRLWRQARITVDIQKLISNMSELERVDLFNAVERYLLREIKVYILPLFSNPLKILNCICCHNLY
jgi:hypothetical protein